MIFKLIFLKSAIKEWDKLDSNIKEQFKAKIIKRLENPFIPKDKLSSMKDCYKIKLKTLGYRLVYKVINERLVVQVITIGKREKDFIYKLAKERLNDKN